MRIACQFMLFVWVLVPLAGHSQTPHAMDNVSRNEAFQSGKWNFKAARENTSPLRGQVYFKSDSIHEARIDQPTESRRVGNWVSEPGGERKQLVFSDSQILQGRAYVEFEPIQKTYKGYFDDLQKQRWKFELRRVANDR